MAPLEPSHFYTGLVADLYATLRSEDPDPEPYARFIARTGEPALELGCGDGDPLLALRRRGLQVEGLDSSIDMLDRLRARAEREGLDVVLHHSTIELMDLGRRYRSIFLAGATFNLILDDDLVLAALERIRVHLAPGGAALIPLFVPAPVPSQHWGRASEHVDDDGTLLRCTTLSVDRDDETRRQSALLRYERIIGDHVEMLDRAWVLHWHTQSGFRQLATAAGLGVRAVVGADGRSADEAAQQFTFVLEPR